MTIFELRDTLCTIQINLEDVKGAIAVVWSGLEDCVIVDDHRNVLSLALNELSRSIDQLDQLDQELGGDGQGHNIRLEDDDEDDE